MKLSKEDQKKRKELEQKQKTLLEKLPKLKLKNTQLNLAKGNDWAITLKYTDNPNFWNYLKQGNLLDFVEKNVLKGDVDFLYEFRDQKDEFYKSVGNYAINLPGSPKEQGQERDRLIQPIAETYNNFLQFFPEKGLGNWTHKFLKIDRIVDESKGAFVHVDGEDDSMGYYVFFKEGDEFKVPTGFKENSSYVLLYKNNDAIFVYVDEKEVKYWDVEHYTPDPRPRGHYRRSIIWVEEGSPKEGCSDRLKKG